MKSKTANILNYTGTVTLSQYIGAKKIKILQEHNAGAFPLFNFLSDCLVGDFDIAKTACPNKIMLLKKRNSADGYDKASLGFIYLMTKPEKVFNTDKGIVRYSFTISRDLLDGTDFDSIGLYTSSTVEDDYEKYAAVCELKGLNESTLSTYLALVVDWELHISN